MVMLYKGDALETLMCIETKRKEFLSELQYLMIQYLEGFVNTETYEKANLLGVLSDGVDLVVEELNALCVECIKLKKEEGKFKINVVFNSGVLTHSITELFKILKKRNKKANVRNLYDIIVSVEMLSIKEINLSKIYFETWQLFDCRDVECVKDSDMRGIVDDYVCLYDYEYPMFCKLRENIQKKVNHVVLYIEDSKICTKLMDTIYQSKDSVIIHANYNDSVISNWNSELLFEKVSNAINTFGMQLKIRLYMNIDKNAFFVKKYKWLIDSGILVCNDYSMCDFR